MNKLLLIAAVALSLTACNDYNDQRYIQRPSVVNHTTVVNETEHKTVVVNQVVNPTPRVTTISQPVAGKPAANAKVYDVKTNQVVTPKPAVVVNKTQTTAIKNTPSMSSYSAPKSTSTWSSSRSTTSFRSSSSGRR